MGIKIVDSVGACGSSPCLGQLFADLLRRLPSSQEIKLSDDALRRFTSISPIRARNESDRQDREPGDVRFTTARTEIIKQANHRLIGGYCLKMTSHVL